MLAREWSTLCPLLELTAIMSATWPVTHETTGVTAMHRWKSHVVRDSHQFCLKSSLSGWDRLKDQRKSWELSTRVACLEGGTELGVWTLTLCCWNRDSGCAAVIGWRGEQLGQSSGEGVNQNQKAQERSSLVKSKATCIRWRILESGRRGAKEQIVFFFKSMLLCELFLSFERHGLRNSSFRDVNYTLALMSNNRNTQIKGILSYMFSMGR